MKEYEKYILNVSSDDKESICGKNISSEFYFVNIEHSLNEIKVGGRLLPCPKCK